MDSFLNLIMLALEHEITKRIQRAEMNFEERLVYHRE